MPRHPALAELDALVGEWDLRASAGGTLLGRSRARFAWLEGGDFLVQDAEAVPDDDASSEWTAAAPFPLRTLVGLDDGTGLLTMLYADARGVFRVYAMTLEAGAWRIWRDAPGFFQRFTGSFGDGGRTITGRWESSPDGEAWEPDFDLTYTRIA